MPCGQQPGAWRHSGACSHKRGLEASPRPVEVAGSTEREGLWVVGMQPRPPPAATTQPTLTGKTFGDTAGSVPWRSPQCQSLPWCHGRARIVAWDPCAVCGRFFLPFLAPTQWTEGSRGAPCPAFLLACLGGGVPTSLDSPLLTHSQGPGPILLHSSHCPPNLALD